MSLLHARHFHLDAPVAMTPPMARPPAQVLGFNSVPSVSPVSCKREHQPLCGEK